MFAVKCAVPGGELCVGGNVESCPKLSRRGLRTIMALGLKGKPDE